MTESKPQRSEAVALAYTAGETAPRVVAKGKGVLARRFSSGHAKPASTCMNRPSSSAC